MFLGSATYVTFGPGISSPDEFLVYLCDIIVRSSIILPVVLSTDFDRRRCNVFQIFHFLWSTWCSKPKRTHQLLTELMIGMTSLYLPGMESSHSLSAKS